MAGHLKSSSENDLALHGQSLSFGQPNFSFRKLPRRSNSMPSIVAESMSAQMKQYFSEIHFGVGKLKDTLMITKETSDEYLNEYSQDDEETQRIQQDSSSVIEPYYSKTIASDTGVDVDSVTDMSIDGYIDSDPPTLDTNEMNKRNALKDIQFKIDLNNWFCDKDISLSKVEKAKIDYRENLLNEYNTMQKGFEYEIASLRAKTKSLEEELRQCRDVGKLQAEENRKIFEEHQKELQRLKKDGLQDSKKQFSEMKHLHMIIEKLERKLGFEAGFCLQIRPGKGDLDEALSRVKVIDTWDEKGVNEKRLSNEKIVNGGMECDVNGLVNELPGRLLAKPHNDPERILHRKIVELSSLIRKLDEKNQQLAIRNEELVQEIELTKDDDKKLEERTTELGGKNMELVHQLRKLESQVKEYEERDCEREERIVQLQELVEKKDKKMRSNKKKILTPQQVDEYEDLQRQNKEQLQIISELRQLTLEKERRMDMMKRRYAADANKISVMPRSVSMDSLNYNCEDLPVDSETTTTDSAKRKKREEANEARETHRERLQRITKEHLELQHAYSLLQQHVGEINDPQRSQLNRESLQSDLLVSQATINELEAQLEDKDKRIGKSVEEYQSKAGMVQTMEERNEDLHQKLVDAESHLVEKTLLLKKLTEEMKEVMDQNDLMEFRITEMENVLKPKAHYHLTTPDDDLATTDPIGGEINAISVRISLKELEINKQHCFSITEKKNLVEARAYLDKLDKEMLTLKRNDMVLKRKIEDVTKKYEKSQNSLVEQGNELTHFWKENSKIEEAELLKIGGLTSPFDKMMSDIDDNPAKLLSEAKDRIQDLEQTNDILLNKMEAFNGSKVNLSDEEVGLLYKKVDQLRDAEKQINLLKISNDELLHRIKKFEMNEVTQHRKENSKSSGHGALPAALAEEISKLKKENEELNSEMGTLRLRADDALAIAQKTKEVLNKEDQETQTPSEESFICFPNIKKDSTTRELIDASIQTVFNADYVKKFQDLTIGHVIKHSTANLICDEHSEVDSPEDTTEKKDVANVDENQLQADNAYIEKVLQGLQVEEEQTDSVFHSTMPDGKNFREPDESDKSDNSTSSFSGYLKKTNDFGVQVGLNEGSSNTASVRSSIDMINDDHASFCHVDDVSLKSASTTKLLKAAPNELASSTHTQMTCPDDNVPPFIDVRMPSACSTCGVTPPLLNHNNKSKAGTHHGIYSSTLLRQQNGDFSYDVPTDINKDKSFNCVCSTCGSSTPSDVIPDLSNSSSLFVSNSSETRVPPAGASTITRCPTCGVNPSHIAGDPTNLDCLTCGLIQSYQSKRRSSSPSSISSHMNEKAIRSSDYVSKKYEEEVPLGNDKPCLNCGMTSPIHPHIPSNICSICGFTNLQTDGTDTVNRSHVDFHQDLHAKESVSTKTAVGMTTPPYGSDTFTLSTSHITSYGSGACAVTTTIATDYLTSNIMDTYQNRVSSVTHISTPSSETGRHSPYKSPLLHDGTLQIVSPRAVDLGETKYEYYGHTTGRLFTPEKNTESLFTNVDTEVERLLDYGKRLQETPEPINDRDYKDEPDRLPEFTVDPMRRHSYGNASTVSNESVRACHKIEYDDGSNSSLSSIQLLLPTVIDRSKETFEHCNTEHGVCTLNNNGDKNTPYSTPYGDKIISQVTPPIPIHASSSQYPESAEYLGQASRHDASYVSRSRDNRNYKSVTYPLDGGSVDIPLQNGELDGTLVGVKDFSTMSEALNNEESISMTEVKEDIEQVSIERRNLQPPPSHQDTKTYPESKSEATSYLDADVDRSLYRSGLKHNSGNHRKQPCVPKSIKLSHLPLPGDKRLSIDYPELSKSLPLSDATTVKESVFGLASSKYKFPSDSELSKQSGSSSDIESYMMNETRQRARRLPMMPNIILKNRRTRSPSRSPPHLLSKRVEYEYKGKYMRTNESHNDDDEGQSNCPGNQGVNPFEMRTPRYKLSDVPSLCREIMFLRQECDSMERQLMNKETVVRAMQDELKEESENMAILEQKDKEINLKSESLSQITQLLQKTKKELEHKSSECNRRENEIKHIREELKSISDEKKVLEHTLSEQQLKIIKLESAESRLAQMTDKYDQLLGENRELVERIKNLEINEKEFIDLERNVIELQTQLHDMEDIELHRDELLVKLQDVKKQRDEFLEKGKMVEEERNEFVRSNKTLEQYILEWKRKTTEFKKTNQGLKDRIMCCEKDKKELEARIQEIQSERTSMQTVINKLEGERDDLLREMREMKLDRNALEAKTADLEDAMYDYDHLEEGFHSLRLKLAELTRQRDDTELLIPSYKAKVKVLKKTVREKEESIMQLSHEIKTMKVIMENFTYDDLSHFKSISGVTSDSSHTNQRSTYSKKYRPSDMNMTSESETYDLLMSRSQPVHAEYSDDSESFTKEERKRNSSNRRKGKKYVALFDYDPYKSSTARQPERELRLKEGDNVTAYGKMNIDGYLEAEVGGARGLVPSIYLEEISEEENSHNIQYTNVKNLRSGRERHMVALYDYDPYTMGTTDRPELQLPLRKGDLVKIYGTVNTDGYYVAVLNGKEGLVPSNFVEEHSPNSFHMSIHNGLAKTNPISCDGSQLPGPPFAPRDLKVIRVVTKNAVLLGWQLPNIDDQDRSNGCRVIGYKIWVNGKLKQEVNSAKMTKAFVDDVDLHGRVEFSIQTMGEQGLYSEKCHFAITGALSTLTTNAENTDSKSNLYVALYDYDPQKSSPNPNPTLEVSFQEGDLIKVFDTTRSDGFYGAEVNGRKGLVPSNFIEKVTNADSGGSNLQHSQKINNLESDSRRVSFKSKEVL